MHAHVGLDHTQDRAGGLGADHPRKGGVDHPDGPVRQVTRERGGLAGQPHLGLPAHGDQPVAPTRPAHPRPTPGPGSAECTAAHCASTTKSLTSASRRPGTAADADADANSPAASRPGSRWA